MTHLARSRSDQFIDLLGEVTGTEPRPEPGYRRRPESDWLAEFADEDTEPAREHGKVLPDPPQSFQLELERAMPGTTTRRFAALALMILLAAVASAIGAVDWIVRPGNLPDVHLPALAELTSPPIPAAPQPDVVPRAPETSIPHSIPEAPVPNSEHPVREAEALGPRSLPVSGSSPRQIETAAVQGVLDRYRAAFGALSTAGIEDFWPGAGTPALARTFEGLQSQRLDFQSCGVELSAGGRATARCRGRAAFVPKGDRSVRVESRAWLFRLSRVNDRWIIMSVESR